MAAKAYLIPGYGIVNIPDGSEREYLIPGFGIINENNPAEGVEVSATCPSLTLSTYDAVVTVNASVEVQAASVSLTLTKYSAAISYDVNVAASCPSLTLTKYNATVDHDTVNAFDTDPHCVALWKFESGALTTDSIGTNTLTNSGVAENTTYVYEGECAADFEYNDNTDGLTIDDSDLDSGFPLKDGESNRCFSLCFWMRPESIFAHQIFSKGSVFDNNCSFIVTCLFYASNYVELIIWNAYDGGTEVETWSVNNFPVGAPYHVSIMHDGDNKTTTVRFYNSDYDVAYTRTHNWTYQTEITDGPLCIGNESTPASGYGFDGIIDEMVVFDRLISVGEADAIRNQTFSYHTGDILSACAELTLTQHNATVLYNVPVEILANTAELTLSTYSAALSDADNINVRVACLPLTMTAYKATVFADVTVFADCATLVITPKYAEVSFDSHAVIETGWSKDRGLGPWEFNKPPKKYGYINNPRWVAKNEATTIHKPCGYWPLVYSEIGWYQQVVAVDSSRKLIGASMISQDNEQYKLIYLNYETDKLISQVDLSSSTTQVHTYYGATMMFDNADGVPRILYLNYEDTNLRSYAYDYTGRMTDVTLDTAVSIDWRTQGAYLGSGVAVAVNYKDTSSYLYKTSNYGNSWSAGSVIVAAPCTFAAGTDRLYAMYHVFDDTQPIRGKFSDNQGTTWFDFDNLPDEPETYGAVQAVAASGDNVCVVYTVSSALVMIYSNNKGATWGGSYIPAIDGEAAIDFDNVYLNGSIGMIYAYGTTTGAEVVLRSDDGGATWEQITKFPTFITSYNVPTVEKTVPMVWSGDDNAMVATFCGYAIYPGDLAFQVSFDDGESWAKRSLHVGGCEVNYGPNPVWTMPN